MRIRKPFVVAIVIAVMAIGVGVVAQTSDDSYKDALRKYLGQLVASGAIPSPADSVNWRALSSDMGLLLREDADGILRATIYVLQDGQWAPVAVDGFSEVAPRDMLLQRQGL